MTNASLTLGERVSRAVRFAPHLSGQTIKTDTLDGHVVIFGSVQSYYQKQMAQETVRRVDGVTQVANELNVTGRSIGGQPHASF